MDLTQLPSSIDEVVSLVHRLYRPGAPGEVARVQEILQQLQRSPQGWQLAHGLLSNENDQVRFFGALTFTVKLNTDAKSLSDEDADNLLTTLIDFLIRAVNNNEKPLVVRKLCSTLVAYFLQFSSRWTRCVRHLILCLANNQAITHPGASDKHPDTATLINTLSDAKVVAVFWFSGGLVDEVGKMDSNSMKQHKFHQQVVPSAEDAVPLMSKYISQGSSHAIRNEALKCFQSWASYSHRAFIDDHIVLDPLRTLTKPTIMCMAVDELYETSVEIITEILSNYSKFLTREDTEVLFSLLTSPWAQTLYQGLISGDFDFEYLQFGMLLLAFGDANTQELATDIGNGSQYEQLLPLLCGLLNAQGYAVQEDKIFVPALEFWTTYVETVLDASYDDVEGKERWLPTAQSAIFQALGHCMRKIQFPPAPEFSGWDSVDRTSFKDARRDFSDLIQQFYLVTGIQILDLFIRYADEAITSSNWAELEVAWFVILWLCDSIAEHEQRDEYLGRILKSSVLNLITDPSITLPTRTKRTFLELIKSYSDYFVANNENLPIILNIVFNATNTPSLANLASHSISKLCSECRTVLLPQLHAFLQQYEHIIDNPSLDGVVKEGVIEGIAALIQAIPDDHSKIGPLNQLLNTIEKDVQKCLGLSSNLKSHAANGYNANNDDQASDPAVVIGLVALKCLEGMAKGSQMPADLPVDLEKSDDSITSTFWTIGEGAALQHRIVTMIHSIMHSLQGHGEIVESSCQILRKGFQESDPGPFVLPPEVAAQVIMAANSQTPRLGFVIRTASNLINTQKGAKSDSVAEALLQWVSQLLRAQGEPGHDPEIAQDGIEFLNRMLPKYLHVLLNHQPPNALEFLFMFTLKALAGSDPLPKAAACDFWTTFASLTNLSPSLQDHLTSILQHFGPLLAQALVYNIGGHAARSELDKLSEPVRKLVIRHPQVKGWLEGALYAETFPSQNVGEQEKKVWLMKVISQRGGKMTNQIVREFWLACRGSNFSYVS